MRPDFISPKDRFYLAIVLLLIAYDVWVDRISAGVSDIVSLLKGY